MAKSRFTPDHLKNSIEIATFLKVTTQEARTGQFDIAISKLLRAARSESKMNHTNNAGLFYNRAADIMSESGLSEYREQAKEIYKNAAAEFHKSAAALVDSEKKISAARTYKREGDVHISSGEGDLGLREGVKCYAISAKLFEDCAVVAGLSGDELPKIRALFTMAAEMYVKTFSIIDSYVLETRSDKEQMAALLESASNSYEKAGNIVKSAECLVEANFHRL